jgi:hypothetical protein
LKRHNQGEKNIYVEIVFKLQISEELSLNFAKELERVKGKI